MRLLDSSSVNPFLEVRMLRRTRHASSLLAPFALALASCSVEPALDSRTAALEGDELCQEAYDEATEHSCGHVASGPFATANAAATIAAARATINLPHTAYTVNLPAVEGEHYGVVLYRPTETTNHLFYVDPDVTLTLTGPSGEEILPIGEAPVDPAVCNPDDPTALLTRYAVYPLEEGVYYHVAFGPTTDASVTVIVEHIEEFAGVCEVCEPITLRASRSYLPASWEDAEVELDEHVVFELPAELPVVEGNAGNGWAILSFLDEETGSQVACYYRGGASTPIPLTPPQLALATRYNHVWCQDGSVPGDDIETDHLRLRVQRGGNIWFNQQTVVELVLETECGGHDHEEH
jgi:hypothetical protein